eukprot:220624-Prymnesium_polylepis.1
MSGFHKASLHLYVQVPLLPNMARAPSLIWQAPPPQYGRRPLLNMAGAPSLIWQASLHLHVQLPLFRPLCALRPDPTAPSRRVESRIASFWRPELRSFRTPNERREP